MVKILLVEDDENITRSLSELLLKENFAVKSADTQKKAMALLENNSFDIVLFETLTMELSKKRKQCFLIWFYSPHFINIRCQCFQHNHNKHLSSSQRICNAQVDRYDRKGLFEDANF